VIEAYISYNKLFHVLFNVSFIELDSSRV